MASICPTRNRTCACSFLIGIIVAVLVLGYIHPMMTKLIPISLAPKEKGSGENQDKSNPFVQNMAAVVKPAWGRESSAIGHFGQASAAGGQASAAGGQASAMGGQVSAVDGQASAAGGQASAMGGQASAVDGQASAGGGQPSAMGGQASAAGGQASAADGQASAAGGQTSAAGGQASAGSGQKPVTDDQEKDIIDNSYAYGYFLTQYYRMFKEGGLRGVDANKPETIKYWWQAAAMIDWYFNTPLRYLCKNITRVDGEWYACMDEPYTVKPPCLVYSFGINWNFRFDDKMGQMGCDVHSFDPSMHKKDFVRSPQVKFYGIGIGSKDNDSFVPKRDSYVRKTEHWKMRTLESIKKELGHENRVIDHLKMDVEGYEWEIIDNMIDTGVFKYIRQFSVEFHIFPAYPKQEDYIKLYKIYTKLREHGLREYKIGPHTKTLVRNKFNNQADIQFVNSRFKMPQTGK